MTYGIIIYTDVDLSSMGFRAMHMRAISQELLDNSSRNVI